MAADTDETDADGDIGDALRQNGRRMAGADMPADDLDNDDEGEEEEEEPEPKLKYTKLTEKILPVYSHGDSTSTFLAVGDKMVIGTHSGNIHVLTLPSLQSLRQYHAHSLSITALSVSPFPSTTSPAIATPLLRSNTSTSSRPSQNAPSSSKPSAPTPVPATPSNSIFIATASMDGHVCVSSLVDANDVSFRNYARPVNAVAMSPEYKSDRSYLSGGLAGNLILTAGAQTGVTTNANTNSTAGSASGWLGSIGLGSNNGRDTILHSGEGGISTIKWSLSGRYVVWVNEQGIKIMRSNISLDAQDIDSAWKRIGHVERPNRRVWEDMASVWKARVEWANDDYINDAEMPPVNVIQTTNGNPHLVPPSPGSARGSISSAPSVRPRKSRSESLLVGWGDTVWMMHVKAGSERGKTGFKIGKVEIVHKFMFDDCIVSGIALYTPSLLLALVYRTTDDNNVPVSTGQDAASKRGARRRHNALPPDLRLIDLDSPEKMELEAESWHASRFDTLYASDYHLSVTHSPRQGPATATQRSALEALGNIGGGLWDASKYATGGLWDASKTATRLLVSSTGVMGTSSGSEKSSLTEQSASGRHTNNPQKDISPSLSKPGLKIFIHSSYDCLLAIKRDLSDHFSWLQATEKYEKAWQLIDRSPEVVAFTPQPAQSDSQPSTPTKSGQSLADFFADESSSQTTSVGGTAHNSNIEKEKRRIGDLWIQQLVTAGDWSTAGSVCAKVLGETSRWEHWIWTFAEAGKFDEITPCIPRKPLKPVLPSLTYEVVLGHYLNQDKPRLQALLEQWAINLYDISSVTAAIESKLETGDVRRETYQDGVQGRDWTILQDCLAKLYLADARPAEALKCYMRTRNADGVFNLVREYGLLSSISTTIYDFLTICITSSQPLSSFSLDELSALTTEPFELLIDGATEGVILPDAVIPQVHRSSTLDSPLLFLYFRALWLGPSAISPTQSSPTTNHSHHHVTRSRFDATSGTLATTTRALLAPHADLAVDLFATYSRPLLSSLLKSSTAYNLAHALAVCESRHYTPELVHLLSATGQTKRALALLLPAATSPADIAAALAFAREQDDSALWDDILAHAADKPAFLRALLEQLPGAGLGVDPARLVRAIPERLEIEGLKPGLVGLLRDEEVQASISEGAARVLRSEVAASLELLRRRRTRGTAFGDDVRPIVHGKAALPAKPALKCAVCMSRGDISPAAAAAALSTTADAVPPTAMPDHLLGFSCGHLVHLTCVLESLDDTSREANTLADGLHRRVAQDTAAEQREGGLPRGRVGVRVAQAQLVASMLDKVGFSRCPACPDKKMIAIP